MTTPKKPSSQTSLADRAGKLITIEGIEGSGKSTAQQFIKKYLKKQGIKTTLTREPGGTPLAESIRNVLLYARHTESLLAQTELLLMFASRAQHLHHRILPALAKGDWVISDRYIDASYAYQGGGRGISTRFIQQLDKAIVGTCYPHLTLLLDVSPIVGMQRVEKRNMKKDRIEREKIIFFEHVRMMYLKRAMQDPKRIIVIDASQSITKIQAALTKRLNHFLKEVRHHASI